MISPSNGAFTFEAAVRGAGNRDGVTERCSHTLDSLGIPSLSGYGPRTVDRGLLKTSGYKQSNLHSYLLRTPWQGKA
jgi:hypothetical protein